MDDDEEGRERTELIFARLCDASEFSRLAKEKSSEKSDEILSFQIYRFLFPACKCGSRVGGISSLRSMNYSTTLRFYFRTVSAAKDLSRVGIRR